MTGDGRAVRVWVPTQLLSRGASLRQDGQGFWDAMREVWPPGLNDSSAFCRGPSPTLLCQSSVARCRTVVQPTRQDSTEQNCTVLHYTLDSGAVSRIWWPIYAPATELLTE